MIDLQCAKYDYQQGHLRLETSPILREALLNACINKDYAEPSPIQIRVYENKLEIINGGVLPEGWTVETLLSSHRSMPYNPDIANTFSELERLRHGDAVLSASLWLARMTDSPRRNSAMTLREFGRHLSLSIRKGLRPNTTQKRPKRTTQKRPATDQQKQENVILELIKENPYIQRKELVSRLGIHESSVKRRLASLQEKGIIRHVGPNKGGYWEVQEGF